MTKAFLIDGASKSISEVNADSQTLASLVGFDTIAFDELGNNEMVFFDEECFIRGIDGRFRIDTLPPISGKAVVAAGSLENLEDTQLSLDELQGRLSFS